MLSVSLLDCTDVDFMVEWLCTKLLVVCHLFLFFCLYCVYDFILYIYIKNREITIMSITIMTTQRARQSVSSCLCSVWRIAQVSGEARETSFLFQRCWCDVSIRRFAGH